ncbi:hypothetical protein ACJD0Z_04140 [Flavobacteriaceae bacterium M23B6Z8]
MKRNLIIFGVLILICISFVYFSYLNYLSKAKYVENSRIYKNYEDYKIIHRDSFIYNDFIAWMESKDKRLHKLMSTENIWYMKVDSGNFFVMGKDPLFEEWKDSKTFTLADYLIDRKGILINPKFQIEDYTENTLYTYINKSFSLSGPFPLSELVLAFKNNLDSMKIINKNKKEAKILIERDKINFLENTFSDRSTEIIIQVIHNDSLLNKSDRPFFVRLKYFNIEDMSAEN